MSKKVIDVFIADDDPKALRYFQAVLNKVDDIRCLGSTTRADAVADVVLTTRPDVVLVDYNMIEDVSFNIVKRIHEKLPNMPIIMLGDRENRRESALALGATEYLVLPILPKILIESVRRVLQADSPD